MRKWKKIPASLLLTSMVCFSLTACQAQKSNNDTDNTTPTTTNAAEAVTTPAANSTTTPAADSAASNASSSDISAASDSSEAASESPAPSETLPASENAAASENTVPSTSESAPAPATESSTLAQAGSNIVVRTDGSALNADASMTYPILNVGSEALNAAINNDIVSQNTALLQKYAASYSDVRLNYQTAFLDSKIVVYTSYYMDYTQPGNNKSNTFMFTRIYDLNRGGAAVRIMDLTYSARELAQALLTQDLNTYSNASLDPSIWEAQKSIILSQTEDELTAQLEKADFGSNNPSATIFTRKPAEGLITIYYPVGASLGDYAAFTIKVYE